MAVTQVGTPATTVYTTTSGTNTPTLAWSGTQPRTAGDILVLAVTAAATTSVTLPATPSGWTAGPATGNTATTPHAGAAIFWKVAAGSDAVPSISVTTSGTTRCGFSLFELTGAESILSPVDTTGTYASGSGSATIASMTVTAGANAAYSGEYAIAAFAREQATAATATYTQGGSWSNFGSDAGTSTRDHNFVDYYATPAQGSAASDAATITSAATSYAAGVLATFAPPHDPGPALVPLSQPPGVRVSLQLAGQALASVIPQVAVAPPTPAPLYPLQQPVDGYRRTARPPRGIVRGIAGAALAVSVLGPPITPLHGPVAGHARRALPPRGHVISRTGTFSGTGPALTPLHQPIRGRLPLPAPGRAAAIAAIPAPAGPTTGPPIPPRAQPWRAPIPAPHRGGYTLTRAGVYSGQGPAVRPLTSPVKAHQPLSSHGIKYSRAGTFSGTGPSLTPLHYPVAPAVRPLPARGHVITRSGTFAGEGPAFIPLKVPIRARQPLPPRGTVISRTGTFSGTGPPIPPRAQPVRAVPVRLPSGRAITLRIVQVAAAPGAGPQLYPPHAPVRAALPAPSRRGYIRSAAGTYAGEGPAVRPLTGPLQARRPLPPPGRVLGAHQGTYSGEGPAVRPLTGPIRARQPLPPQGRVLGVYRVTVQVPVPTTGPPLTPLHQPVHPARPLPPAGRIISRAGTFSSTGPPLTPSHQPVRIRPAPVRRGQVLTTPVHAATVPAQPRSQPWRAPLPAQPRPGYIRSSRVTAGQIPGPAPLHTPVRARLPQPLRGQVLGVTRVTAVPPAPVTGPPVYPLHQPVRARQPLPPRGRALGVYQVVVLPPPPTTGPPIPPRAQPWRAILPAPHQHGAAITFLIPIYPPPPIVTALFAATGARWRWGSAGTQWKWGTGGARNQ